MLKKKDVKQVESIGQEKKAEVGRNHCKAAMAIRTTEMQHAPAMERMLTLFF